MEVKIVKDEQGLADTFEVRKKVFIEEQNVPEDEEIDEFESGSTHFILYLDGIPSGAGRFRILDGAGKVERICVLQSARNTGAGTAIMDKIEEYAKSKSTETLKLNAQTQAIPFYEKLGYQIVSEEFMDAGIPHRTMKKSL
ncbi:GNAT family N-acetyltransferase [Mesobacillus zeae]|uniref:GNAT family N-acetyltransferase n=1 Tax=Mesobacillus zeae TaxID=1917180 RepID=A0A398AZC3_9BACI|nr:GNAT family N-acetyltransferase [Mesobacillus zeae]RID82028.1 GNAT family N-acetyltransferase [Mesobacillus zeae]